MVIKTTKEEMRRYLMNCALTDMATDGREFEPKIDNVSLLRVKVGEDFLKKHYGKRYPEVKHRIELLTESVAILCSYFSDIKKDVLDREDISSRRFLRYQRALSHCFKEMVFIDELLILLVAQTDLVDKTIPHHYWMILKKEEKEKPLDQDEQFEFESQMEGEDSGNQ